MKILLDPSIYWFEDDENKIINLKYWDKVTGIIEKYFDIKYISSNEIIKTLYRLNREPTNFNKQYSEKKQLLIKRLFSNLDYENNINEKDTKDYILPPEFIITSDNLINKCFTNILDYVVSNNEECLLFLSLKNHNVKISEDTLFLVNHISGEINSKITELIANKEHIRNDLKVPTLIDPIPFDDLCDNFLVLQNSLVKKNNKISVFWEITREVALRNLYTYDEIVTSKNASTNHKRRIYTYQKKLYISADFESGCFELCDSKGIHQGEISYTGDQLSPKDVTGKHNINI